jgi:hypothetical protein
MPRNMESENLPPGIADATSLAIPVLFHPPLINQH